MIKNIIVFYLTFFISNFILFSDCQKKKLCYLVNEELVENCGDYPDKIIAYSTYEEKEGWHIFYVKSNSLFDNAQQSYAAGFLEGYIYCNYINYHFTNIKNTLYNGKIDLSQKALNFIKEQREFVSSFTVNPSNDYEETIKYLLKQYEGMYNGYCKGYKEKEDKYFPFLSEEEFYYISYLGDLYDINKAFPKNEEENINNNNNKFLFYKECTGYVKYLPESNDIIVAHNTHNIYSMMNRIYKHYDINLKLSSGKITNSVKFTSRPGDLNSKDDFYITSSQMVIIETSLEIYNTSLYSNLRFNTVPKWIRVNIANKLGTTNKEWSDLFYQYNSGTHNNQWVITDYKQIETKKDIVYLLEQTANINERYIKDMTDILLTQGYIGSYNAPYFEEVKKETGGSDENDYYHARRFFIIRALDRNIKDVEGTKFLIDYHDSVNLCDQIGARCDINQNNPFGAIDAKITNSVLVKDMKSYIRYGPPYINGVTLPFEFGDKYKNFSHYGIPDKFEFNWIKE